MTIPSSGPRTERGRGPEHPVELERIPAGADAHKRVTDGGLRALHGKGTRHLQPQRRCLGGQAGQGGAQGPPQGDAAGSGARGRFHQGMPQASEQSRTHCPAGPTWAQNSRGPRLRGAVPTGLRFTSRDWTKPWNNPLQPWGRGQGMRL